MAKKISLVFLLFVFGTLCFAKGQRDTFEIGMGYHSTTETQESSGVVTKTTMPSFAINFAGETFYTEKVGIGVYGNMLFPQELKVSIGGWSATADKSAYDFLFGMDALVGPAFMLYKSDFFCLPLAVGIHWSNLWAVTASSKVSGTEVGLGANITGECHFNPSVYFYGRLQISLDFYSWGTKETSQGSARGTTSFSGELTTWGVEPCFGIGFQW